MRLIIVTGMPGSGKEEFLSAAVSMGIQFIRMGDVVREHHSASGSGLAVGEYAGTEREIHGFDIWAKRCIDRMHGTVFLVDGCRSMKEAEAFRSLTDDVTIVAIHTSPKVRYERLVARGRSDAPSDRKEFAERDSREIGWGISEVIVLSDVMIVNDGPLKDFRKASKKLLKGIR
jgi:dephospho-CoA kinase